MSVINDMLRDLDQRRAPARETIAGAQAANLVAQEQRWNGWNGWIVAMVVTLLLAGALAAWASIRFFSDEDHEASLVEPLPSLPLVSKTDTNLAVTEDENDLVSPNMATQANAETAQKVKQSTVKSGQGQTENHVVAVPSRPEASQKATLNPAVAHNEKVSRISAVENSAEPVGRQQSSSERASAKDAVSKQVVAPTEKPLATDNARTKQLAANLVVEAEETSPASEVRLTPIALDQRTAQSAKALIDSGEGEIARRLLYDFIAEHEQDSASRAMLAKHLLQQQRVAEAGDVLAVVGPEDLPELKAVKARWLVVSGRMPEALTLLATDLPSVEQYTDYHALLASFYHQQQQFDRAVERYSALLEYDSNQADWWVGMGIGLDQLKRYEDAALAYRQALALPNLKQSLARFSEQRLKQLSSRQRSGA